MNWLLDVDVVGIFDNIDHCILLRCCTGRLTMSGHPSD
jgi:hypothetical protein